MSEKKSEYNDRIKKLAMLHNAGIDPYPATTNRDTTVAEVLQNFTKLQTSKKTVVVAGRLRSLRLHGNLAFADLEDASGRLQVVFNKKNIDEKSYKLFTKVVDIGDFIEAAGTVFTTQSGQNSLEIKQWRMLAKALRPVPDERFGLQNEEERLRKRYLDILLDKNLRAVIENKGRFWQAVRNFLLKKGFIEVETLVLETTTGGGDARPFATHHYALDIDVYLRISCGELWQKRLMVAGFEKTFEIGRIFRNEGMSAEHAQDYTQMEFYWAYADYEKGMTLVEELFKHVAQEVFGTLKFKIRGFDIDLGKQWERYDYTMIIKEKTGVDIATADMQAIKAKLDELGVAYDQKGFNITRAIDNLWKYCRKSIAGPGFLVNVPLAVSPLAKKNNDGSRTVQRFQPVIAGSELGNGYSELNDPIDQRKRFSEQQALRDAGDDEAQMADMEFVEALEYGMPPTCGFGFSERVFSFLSDKTLRECQTFPLVREKDTASKQTKTKQTDIAVAVINTKAGLERWQEMNTIAHLTAAFGARSGRGLFMQDTITTKDGQDIKLNIQHAIMIKEATSQKDILKLIEEAKKENLEVAEFTREMLETTDDKKVIKNTAGKNLQDVEYLGILVYGKKSVVDKMTEKFSLYQ